MNRLISLLELQARLSRAGHLKTDRNSGADGTNIDPPVDIYVTVGANCDPTLNSTFRDRYYCCLLISRNPGAGDPADADFAMPEPLSGRQNRSLGKNVTRRVRSVGYCSGY